MPSLTPRERWQVGLAVLTAYVGPQDRRAADITSVASEYDPREVLFGVLAVARDLLGVIGEKSGDSVSESCRHWLNPRARRISDGESCHPVETVVLVLSESADAGQTPTRRTASIRRIL